MSTVTKHYIEYRCPGTLFDETESIAVSEDEMCIDVAVEKAKEVLQRYNSRPYGFRFVTKRYEVVLSDNGKTCRSEPEVTTSGCHYLDGIVLTLDDIPDTEDFRILRSNMRGNDIPAVVRTQNSWQHHGVLGRRDVVLRGTDVIARGEDYYKDGGSDDA